MAKKETSKVEEKENLPDEKVLENAEGTAEEKNTVENAEKKEKVEETSKVESSKSMSLKVVEGFIDKYHRNIIYHKDDILIVKENPETKIKEFENHKEYEISSKRAEELLNTTLVEII